MRKEAKTISKSILNKLKNNEESIKIVKLDIIDYGYPESKCK